MKLFIILFCISFAVRLSAQDTREMLIIVSDPGEAAYETEFRRQAKAWQDLAGKGKMKVQTIGLEEIAKGGDHLLLKNFLSEMTKSGGDLWLVWIGHGSFDGRTANFNLRGKDIDSSEVKELLKPFTRRLIILNLFSASAPFLPPLAGENRIIIGSCRSPGQRNYTRFGEKIADALEDSAADLDFDGSLSLLEVTLHASSNTTAFYEDAQRVLQEHAVIDDNGDGQHTEASSFEGLISTTGFDGPTAREIFLLSSPVDKLSPQAKKQRMVLERSIDELRKRKSQMPEDDYYRELEILMREMAVLYGK